MFWARAKGLTLGIQNDGFNGLQIGTMETSYWQIMATQPLPWPGKLGLRAKAAGLEAKATGASLERVRLTVEADVRRAIWTCSSPATG